MPWSETQWVEILKWLGVGGLAAVILAIATALKYRAEARVNSAKLAREGEAHYAEEAKRLRSERDALLAEVPALRESLRRAEAQIQSLSEQLRALEELIPVALVTSGLLDPRARGMGRVLDHLQDLVVVTTPAEGGSFSWCNSAWERELGVKREDLYGQGWRKFLVPEYQEATRRVEARAWGEPVEGFVNAFRAMDGTRILLRWWTTTYQDGRSFAVARVEDRIAPELP